MVSALTPGITALSPTFVKSLHVALEPVLSQLFVYQIVLFAKPHGKILS